MEVVNLFNFLYLKTVFETLDNVDFIWSSFHQHNYTVFEDWDCSKDDKYCEDERCYWIC
jgi:hypothetical protein